MNFSFSLKTSENYFPDQNHLKLKKNSGNTDLSIGMYR